MQQGTFFNATRDFYAVIFFMQEEKFVVKKRFLCKEVFYMQKGIFVLKIDQKHCQYQKKH